MKAPSVNLSELILRKLAGGDMRLLVLIVSIRRSLAGTIIKGDLSARVQSVLRSLVASKSITETDPSFAMKRTGSTRTLASMPIGPVTASSLTRRPPELLTNALRPASATLH